MRSAATISLFTELPVSVLIEILKKHLPHISSVYPADKDGFRLAPNEISAEQLEKAITPILQANQWIATGIVRGALLIEPYYTKTIRIDYALCLYHVSDSDNREKIQAEGLVLRDGGNTCMLRKYPPRIFFALNLPAAFEFVEFQCRDRLDPVSKRVKRGKDASRIDVWRAWIPDGVQLFRDVLFAGKGGWIEHPIPPEKVVLYHDWREKHAEWLTLRQKGVF
jgi:hypothetical protein